MINQVLGAQLLQASVDEANESDFRILVNDSVKYITIDYGLYEMNDMCFGPALIPLLPPFPQGDWKTAQISRDPATGQPHFTAVSNEVGSGIRKTWHSTTVDYSELEMGEKLRSNVYEVTCPRFNSTIVAKFARFAWEIPQLEDETIAYEWIEGHGIGPDFLGHICEEGRVIGFLTSRVIDFHHATPKDILMCTATLSRLHNLGIKHGDTNKHNFLIHEGRATLIDFDCATKTSDSEELNEELGRLEEQLADTSGRGGRVVENGT